MRRIDMDDQLLESYDPSQSLAWFKKIGLHLALRIILNCFFAHKNLINKKMKIRIYIETIINELLTTHNLNGREIMENLILNNQFSASHFIYLNPQEKRKR